jgi:formylglycine-generating enzyme required for sulfatase activity
MTKKLTFKPLVSDTRSIILFSIVLIWMSSCAATGPGLEEGPASDSGAAAEGGQASHVVVRDTGLEPYTGTIPETTVSFEMVPVPGGFITLRTDDGPVEVEIEPFWIGKTEVTWDEYDVFAFQSDGTSNDPDDADALLRPSRPYGAPDFGFGRRGYAALAMSYVGAMAYAEWLSELTGEHYRLATEAEWEYACRAGLPEDPGRDEDALENLAWYWDNAFDKTHPVASLEPNPWGIYDMLGNAAEWCIGLDGEYYVCGGSYMERADEVHCGARAAQTDAWNATDPQIPKSLWWLSDGSFVGFRIVRPAGAHPSARTFARTLASTMTCVTRRTRALCLQARRRHTPRVVAYDRARMSQQAPMKA